MKTFSQLLIILSILMAIAACSHTTKTTGKGAGSAATTKAETADNNLNKSQKEAKRKSLLKMADETLKELYAINPKIKEKVEKAYAYAVFDDYIYNTVFYVAGKGSGVTFKNPEKEPIYMLMLRAGTGPGVGYTKFRQLLIIKSEVTLKELTTVGFDVEASINATLKVGDFGGSQLYAGSFNPYVDVYTITDAGLDIQANWGGVEFVKDWALNKNTKKKTKSPDKADK